MAYTAEERRIRSNEATRRWRLANPDKNRAKTSRWRKANPQGWQSIMRASKARRPLENIFAVKKAKANSLEIPFSLVFNDVTWPEYCPVLGIKISYARDAGFDDSRASFDRFNPTGPYSPENTLIVSTRANTLRGNRSFEELARLASASTEFMQVYKFYSTLTKDTESHHGLYFET